MIRRRSWSSTASPVNGAEPIGFQGPTSGAVAKTFGGFMSIVIHPAFRLGFIDAQLGRPFDHDHIIARIEAETPKGALKRMGYDGVYWTSKMVEMAQYRYEEGRLAVLMEGLRCKAWGHPDFPPAKVIDYIRKRAEKAQQLSARSNA